MKNKNFDQAIIYKNLPQLPIQKTNLLYLKQKDISIINRQFKLQNRTQIARTKQKPMNQNVITECDRKVHELLVKTHQRLNLKFPFIQQSRQLSAEENQLLALINQSQINYKILVAAMAIDTYTDHITQIYNQADSILQSLSISLSCAHKMKSQVQKLNINPKSQLSTSFNNLYNSLITMTQSASLFNPTSLYLQLYRQILSSSSSTSNFPQTIYSQLKQQNAQLKQRLRINDQKVIDLQIKLTKILQDHQYRQNPIQSTLKNYQIKDQFQKKQQEIQRMNEEFINQIEKYNVVYQTLKRELEEYKSYQNVDTMQLIEKLETEIVMLREEKEQEQMINDELRHRLQLITEKDMHFNRVRSFSKRRQDIYDMSYQVQPLQKAQFQDYYYSRNNQHTDNESDSARPNIVFNNNKYIDRGQVYDHYNVSSRNGYQY